MTADQVSTYEELYIEGSWIPAAGLVNVTDLAEGGTFARVGAATPSDVETALAAAARAQSAMRETTVVQRAEWLAAIAEGIERRRAELVETVVREAGKPIASARSEVDAAAERFRRAVEEARSLDGEFVEGTTRGHEGWNAIVRLVPVGTVVCITPYNYPLSTTAMQVAPALAAGNAVVLKPAAKTPVSGALLAEIAVDAAEGLPPGAFQFLPGRSRDIGEALVGDDRVDAIAMTGSSEAGARVADASGMVTLHMELGGNAPAIVFPDADLDAAAAACTAGSFTYAGQRCSAVSRVLAHDDVHDEVVDRIADETTDWAVSDLFDPATKLGPLVSTAQADHVEALIEDAVDRGATLVRGGDRHRFEPRADAEPEPTDDGRVIEPTLLADVPHDARIVHEEQFGPVAAVTRIDDREEAVALANGGDLGLDAAVFTSDYDRALDLANRVDAGAVRINGAPSHGLGDIPFGGVKASGIGREGIGYTVDAFTERKTIVL